MAGSYEFNKTIETDEELTRKRNWKSRNNVNKNWIVIKEALKYLVCCACYFTVTSSYMA